MTENKFTVAFVLQVEKQNSQDTGMQNNYVIPL